MLDFAQMQTEDLDSAAPQCASAEDARFMQAALAFGRRNLGLTAPNPAVGALLVRDGFIVGRGATAPGGRPHAETEALADAGAAARGATLYVTLEPCSHHGHTAPCADAIAAAGVVRVVSAMQDPDPRVSGAGYARLRAAGIMVTTGVCAEAAALAHRGHSLRITHSRPMLTLKLAQTAEGFAAGGRHDPRLAITGAAANGRVQAERATHDAIMIGIGTALEDDPLLTVRLPGLTRLPLRVVLDSGLRLPPHSRLASVATNAPLLVIANATAPADAEAALRARGAEVARLPASAGAHLGLAHIDLAGALRLLAARGVTRVFSEGGPRTASALIAADLVDELLLFTSPRPFGRQGRDALDAAARARLADAAIFARDDHVIGADRLAQYQRRR